MRGRESVLGDVCVGVLVSVHGEGRAASQQLVHQHAEAPPVDRLECMRAATRDFLLNGKILNKKHAEIQGFEVLDLIELKATNYLVVSRLSAFHNFWSHVFNGATDRKRPLYLLTNTQIHP